MIRPFPAHRLRTATARWQGRREPGSAAFVRGVLAAYRRRDVARRRLALTLLARCAAMVKTIADRHLHIAAMQNWRVQLVVNRLAASGASSLVPVTPPAGGRAESARRAPAVSLPVPARWRALPARLVERMTRVDSPSSSRSALARHQTAIALPPRSERRDAVPLPVVAPAAAVARALAVRPESVAAMSAPASPARSDSRANAVVAPRAVAPPAFDHGELQRLASRVISSIDDRIAAARERLGSV